MSEQDDRYTIDGRRFIWHGLDDDDQRTIDVTLPLRLKLRLIRKAAAFGVELDAAGMFAILEAIAPDQADAIDELDLNDFQTMFTEWQKVYEAQNGATLGEAEGSPA